MLFRDGDDDATTEIAANVLLEYHQPSQQTPPSSLLTLPLYFESLFRKAEQGRTDGVESPYIEAATLAQELIGKQRISSRCTAICTMRTSCAANAAGSSSTRQA